MTASLLDTFAALLRRLPTDMAEIMDRTKWHRYGGGHRRWRQGYFAPPDGTMRYRYRTDKEMADAVLKEMFDVEKH